MLWIVLKFKGFIRTTNVKTVFLSFIEGDEYDVLDSDPNYFHKKSKEYLEQQRTILEGVEKKTREGIIV
jgi:hypothetical protein